MYVACRSYRSYTLIHLFLEGKCYPLESQSPSASKCYLASKFCFTRLQPFRSRWVLGRVGHGGDGPKPGSVVLWTTPGARERRALGDQELRLNQHLGWRKLGRHQGTSSSVGMASIIPIIPIIKHHSHHKTRVSGHFTFSEMTAQQTNPWNWPILLALFGHPTFSASAKARWCHWDRSHVAPSPATGSISPSSHPTVGRAWFEGRHSYSTPHPWPMQSSNLLEVVQNGKLELMQNELCSMGVDRKNNMHKATPNMKAKLWTHETHETDQNHLPLSKASSELCQARSSSPSSVLQAQCCDQARQRPDQCPAHPDSARRASSPHHGTMVNPKIAGIAGMFIWFISPNMAKVYGKIWFWPIPTKMFPRKLGDLTWGTKGAALCSTLQTSSW